MKLNRFALKLSCYLRITLLFVIVTFTISCMSKNRLQKDEMVLSDGKCYTKCKSPTLRIKNKYTVYEYTGTKPSEDDKHTKLEKIITKEYSTHWEKRMSGKNCKSPNLDDCYVYCLVEVPEESIKLRIVKDTNLVKSYKLREITVQESIVTNESEEILCENFIDTVLVSNLISSLTYKGYHTGQNNGILDAETNQALVSYQVDNNLCPCGLTVKTLDLLGIKVQ